jgi:hypothetical protein
VHSRVGFKACRLQACLDHPQPAEWKDRPLEWLIGLQAYDNLVVSIDVASLVGQHGRWVFCIDREYALLSFVGEVRLQFCPYSLCALRRRYKELLVAKVGSNIPDDEIANADGSAPIACPKTLQQSPASTSFLRAALAFMEASIAIMFLICLASRPDARNTLHPLLAE